MNERHTILLVRHAATAGNLRKRYIGVTDEPLSREGVETILKEKGLGQYVRERLQHKRLGLLVLSPMLRCLQTAWLLTAPEKERMKARADSGCGLPDSPGLILSQISRYAPDTEVMLEPQMRECNFGLFEGKNYKELRATEEYQKWIDSGGNMTFPGGENPQDFRDRCCRAFESVLTQVRNKNYDAMLVVHGGTIMSILERYAVDQDGLRRSYYDWHVDNGGAYVLSISDGPEQRIEAESFSAGV